MRSVRSRPCRLCRAPIVIVTDVAGGQRAVNAEPTVAGTITVNRRTLRAREHHGQDLEDVRAAGGPRYIDHAHACPGSGNT